MVRSYPVKDMVPMKGWRSALYKEWYICLQTWYFSGVKSEEEILLGCKKVVAYWPVSSLTRLEPFLR